MKKRVILVGKSAAGKDYARMICEQWLGMTYAVSYTTRPPRDGEVNGKDYNFISMDTAIHEYIKKGRFYEHVIFNGWVYGTTVEQMELDNSVFIMTPKGMSHLSEVDREESLVIFFDIDEDIRRVRMAERGGNADSVDRRIEADRIDFENFDNYDYRVDNPYYTIIDLYDVVSQHMSLPNVDARITEHNDGSPKKVAQW